jgi:hypothetical protein
MGRRFNVAGTGIPRQVVHDAGWIVGQRIYGRTRSALSRG